MVRWRLGRASPLDRRSRRGIRGETVWMSARAGPKARKGAQGQDDIHAPVRVGVALCCTSMGSLGAAAPKRPFRPFWAVPKGPRAGARNIPWQSVPETPRARSTKPPHILGRDRRTAGPGRVGAPGTPCRIPSGIDKKENNSRKSWRAVVDHNFTATCRRTMAQGFAHFPQSFPHRYVNSVPDKKVRETGGRPVSQVRYSRSRITP